MEELIIGISPDSKEALIEALEETFRTVETFDLSKIPPDAEIISAVLHI